MSSGPTIPAHDPGASHRSLHSSPHQLQIDSRRPRIERNKQSRQPGRKPRIVCDLCLELKIPTIVKRTAKKNRAMNPNPNRSAAIVKSRLSRKDKIPGSAICPACEKLAQNVSRYRLRPFLFQYAYSNTPLHDLSIGSVFCLSGNSELIRYEEKGQWRNVGRERFLPLAKKEDELRSVAERSNVRLLDPRPRYKLIKSWISYCEQNHPSCRRSPPETLKHIKVIDVFARQVVTYIAGQQYVALSYVWGGVQADPCSRTGQLPLKLPRTIENAITVTQEIGQRYLWVDGLCIDQSDTGHKAQQISIMDVIYESAFATIFAVNGDNADSGIPGVGSTPRQPQLIASFGDNAFANRTELSTELINCPWSRRGWTFQEALLSTRCIVMTNHQAHFYCHEIMFSESSPEAIRQPRYDGKPDDLVFRRSFGIYRPMEARQVPKLGLYQQLANDYMMRSLSSHDDALAAVSALLSRLSQSIYPGGFLYGLPWEDIHHTLWWSTRSLLSGCVHRRPSREVPSYAWISWKAHNSALGFGTTYDWLPCDTPQVDLRDFIPLYVSWSGLSLIGDQQTSERRNGTRLGDFPGLPRPTLELALITTRLLWDAFDSYHCMAAAMNAPPQPTPEALLVSGVLLTLPCIVELIECSSCCENDQHYSCHLNEEWRDSNLDCIQVNHDASTPSFYVSEELLPSSLRFLVVSCFADNMFSLCRDPCACLTLMPLSMRDGYFERCSATVPVISLATEGEERVVARKFLDLTKASYQEFWLA